MSGAETENGMRRPEGKDRGTAWCSEALAIARHDGRQMVHSPLTAIFQAWFLLALSILIFLVADFLSTDLATFDLLWTFLPWVTLVMAPALAMRAFPETPGDRSLEMTLAMPVATSAVVAGKWLAGTAVLILTLAMTAPFAITVGYLGEPDWGAAAAGYIGAALFLASFYAVALFAASLTRDQVAAYVAALAALTFFLLIGWDSAARALGDGPLAGLAGALAYLSPKYWFDRVAEGRIEAAALVYFVILAVTALAAAALVLEGRRQGRIAAFIPARGVAAAAIGAALLILAVQWPVALDLTEDRIFTLHDETLAVARTSPEGTRITLYLNEDESRIPARIRRHARRVETLFDDMATASGGAIHLDVVRTGADTEADEAAQTAGVRRVLMSSQDTFLFGAVFERGDRRGVIDYFDEARADLLEYDVALALDTLRREKTPRVGILSPLLKASNATEPRPGLAMIEELKRHYDIAIVPHFASELPDGLDALIVIDAPVLRRSMLYAIDQHVMAGRGLIAVTDAYPRFNEANLAVLPEPGDEINDITDLLARYGVRVDISHVVGDREAAALVSGADGGKLHYPFWLRLRGDRLSGNHPATASLNELLFAEAGTLKITQNAAGIATPLVTTSKQTGRLARKLFKDGSSPELAADFEPSAEAKSETLAAALAGPLPSAFGATPPQLKGKDDDKPAGKNADEDTPGQSSNRAQHLSETNAGKVFAVADADWLFDPMAVQTIEAGGRLVTRPLNDNSAFLLNLAEVATGNARLIGIRSRGRTVRTFTTVEAMLKESRARFSAAQKSAMGRIGVVEGKIAEALRLMGVQSAEQLPQSLAADIRKLRRDLLPHKRELREIRQSMREDVEDLQQRLTLANLLSGPLLALAFAALMRLWRRRRWAVAGEY